ncbi:single-stranded-DNA-specific exonuclease RecJ [Parablautia intestinalis]|uniref:Single-stranded-DNA-specific exonuclease RecJ n=1 Tax=Parablautia intestinalis TaxID=2320100 RepID=A0A3A9AEX5_9FIRM|nr:single-stranded-DNA-specific exonuclease RecJ [Parablautia intestinalis]RKI90210.1 single-stranded-DNA-specific exonuclease RecJ [Parablautia intestinalis]
MARWMVAAKKADFNQIAEKYRITPVLARILRNRDIIGDNEIERYLYGDIKDLHDPLLMKGMDKAAEIIQSKIQEGKSLRIIGDYDVDGICSTHILLTGIRALGGKADTDIPHRIKDGYGLNESLIEAAASDGIDTIITCDNGITAQIQIQLAKKLGMTVVVTDHHEVPFEEKEGERIYLLPRADAVVDPKQPGCGYPFKQICGAVVAFKLVQTLFDRIGNGQSNQGKYHAIMDELLIFAALATVCDVMELRDENRIIVKKGLARMNNTSNPGLRALLVVNGLEDKALSPYHAGFIIGPCINATGRLDTAKRALALFEAGDFKEAVTIAGDLKSLNESRKQMTEEGVQKAVGLLENKNIQDKVLVIYLPECHESLAGIIAGRIREKYGKPAFVLTKGDEGIKGSGRSIETYHMYEEMSACKEIFTRFGGHKMAAGLSLPDEESVELFRRKLNENCKLTEEDFEEIVHIDVPMPLAFADRNFIKELSFLEPFGVGNPKPLFARKGISLLTGRKIGKNKNVGKYQIADENNNRYEMIYFGDLEKFDVFLNERFGNTLARQLYVEGVRTGEMTISMAYYPDLNSYGGRESIQIVMQHYC